MAMADLTIVVCLLVGVFSSAVNALRCDGMECYGFNSYCCLDDFGGDTCCFYSVYDYWWFWFAWILFLCFIASCATWCCRRRYRRAEAGYYVIRNDPAPSYGTNWAATTTTTTTGYAGPPPPAYPAGQYQTGAASAPAYPAGQHQPGAVSAPPYQPPPAEKPPAYAP